MKYMGSKRRLAKDIAPIINNLIKEYNIQTYIEPFVGGANMMEHIDCFEKIGSDNNEYLIAMWKDLQDGWQPPKEISREMYYDVKANKDEYGKSLVAITAFCASYNAVWFGSYAGIVKTKTGVIRNYYDESIRNILKQIIKLHNVQFIHTDYKSYTGTKGAMIYCDPPYANQSGYKDKFDHKEFWQWVRDVSNDNIVLVSEYNAPDDFECVYEKVLTTTLDKNSRSKDTERLFIYKPLHNKINNKN